MDQIVNHIGDGFSNSVARVPIDYLNEIIPAMCYNLNTYEVKLSGNKDYLEGLIENIHANEMMIYSENKINIEVI